MVGASIAVINVLLPSLIQANQPKKIGFLTTLYVTSMGIATALASYLAVPITHKLVLGKDLSSSSPCFA